MEPDMPDRNGPAAAATPGPTTEPPALRAPSDFGPALRWALAHVGQVRARRMTWVDPDFSAWPLDDPDLLGALATWARLPQRRLTLIARDWQPLQRRHPRFVAWRRQWTHVVECWSPSEGEAVALPTLVFDDGQLSLQVYDGVSGRGRVQLDEATARHWSDEVDALLQRCEASFPAQTLGL